MTTRPWLGRYWRIGHPKHITVRNGYPRPPPRVLMIPKISLRIVIVGDVENQPGGAPKSQGGAVMIERVVVLDRGPLKGQRLHIISWPGKDYVLFELEGPPHWVGMGSRQECWPEWL